MGNFKILSFLISLSFIWPFGFYNRTEGHVLPPSNIFDTVPVDDARAVGLLHALRDKEIEDDPAVREIAGINLNNMSNYIINVLEAMGRKDDINDAGTLNVFVNNWRNFALEGQYRGENLWRGLLSIAADGEPDLDIPPLLCGYIRSSEAFRSLLPTKVTGTSILESGLKRSVSSLDDYLVAINCDSSVNENFNTFMGDFYAGGGWEMFERLLQPQNNIFGVMAMSFGELEKQKKIEEQADLQEVNSGSGYLGRRQCLSFNPSGQCVIWSNVNIPADMAVETLGALINQNLAWFVTTDEAGENPAAVNLVELIERIFGRPLEE